MKIGFTGTRLGLTSAQRVSFICLIKGVVGTSIRHCESEVEFHQGDCVGADVQAAKIARECGCVVICHPPTNPDMRGFFAADEERPKLSYFSRNRKIVDDTYILIACPPTMTELKTGGTWYTVVYARKRSKPIKIIWPDGTTTSEP